jgi:hypothetical protein
MAGGTRDLNQPTSVGAQWYVERTFRCAPPSPPAPAPNQQAGDKKPPVALGRVKPPVALGRVQPAPTGELSPICAAAQKARANKSPATANLEAQCRAAGGT